MTPKVCNSGEKGEGGGVNDKKEFGNMLNKIHLSG